MHLSPAPGTCLTLSIALSPNCRLSHEIAVHNIYLNKMIGNGINHKIILPELSTHLQISYLSCFSFSFPCHEDQYSVLLISYCCTISLLKQSFSQWQWEQTGNSIICSTGCRPVQTTSLLRSVFLHCPSPTIAL